MLPECRLVPKTILKMQQAGTPDADIQKLVWDNPVGFFAQSGRMDVEGLDQPADIDQRETFAGNSVLRGQEPVK